MRSKQQGSVMVLAAIMLLTLLAFSALAYDIGNILLLRSELKNAAESAAFAGANCLNKASNVAVTDCTSVNNTSTPNWSMAGIKASTQLANNKVGNIAASSAIAAKDKIVEAGYWNLATNKPSGNTSSLSTAATALIAYDTPAVRVSLTQNLVPLSASLFGGVSIPVTMSAVAVITSPNTEPANVVFPMAISQCMFDQYWNSSTGQPKLATTSTLVTSAGNIPQTIGQAWEFRMSSGNKYGTCPDGDWTSFTVNSNNVATTGSSISNNSSALSLGQGIYLVPGAKASLYGNVTTMRDIVVAVVSTVANADGSYPITAFASFYIASVSQGGKYIQGHFTTNLASTGASGIGTNYYGVYSPPRLAQ